MATESNRILTEKEADLVRDGWELSVLPRYEEFGVPFFLRMFKENSDIKALFGFLKNTSEEELAKDSNLSQHANMAFLLAGNSVVALGNPAEVPRVKARLRLLGQLHCKFKTLDEHFPVAKSCLLNILKEGLRSLWTKEMEVAWIKAIDVMIFEMAAGLKNGYNAGL